MAEIRFNYGDKFTQTSDSNTGIGSAIPAGKLDVAGNTKAGSLRVTGIATLSSVSGFVNTKLTTSTQDMIVEAGQSGSVSGEVVVSTGQTISVSTGATTGQGGVHSLKVYETFMPPVGGTADRPTDVKPGMVYYNKDFKTIEFWDGNFWKQVDNTTRSGRGIWSGGTTPTYQTLMDFVTISSLGNAQFFGDLVTDGRGFSRAVSNNVRGINGGGEDAPGGRFNQLEYFTIQSAGDAVDFGDLSAQRGMTGSTSSSTRGVYAGGEQSGGNVNTIEFIEIMTLGDAVDFGDLSPTRKDPHNGLVNSPTRGIFAGGAGPDSIIDMITIASKGNSTKFGDLSQARKGFAGFGNSIRGAFAGGEAHGSPGTVTTMDYITIASEGNAIEFGDTRSSRYVINGGVSNSTRGVWSGGSTALNLIEFINFNTLGDALDFGDLSVGRRAAAGCSDSHGGLGGF